VTNLGASGAAGGPSAFGPERTPYDAIGGGERVRALVETFYDHMDRDPAFARIRALHPADLATSREKLHEFLSGWLGGPPLYIEKHGHPRLRGRHMPFPIGAGERDAWLACMARSLDDLGVDGDLRRFLDARFAHVADFMRNVPDPPSASGASGRGRP
jgi:hemoglobin